MAYLLEVATTESDSEVMWYSRWAPLRRSNNLKQWLLVERACNQCSVFISSVDVPAWRESVTGAV